MIAYLLMLLLGVAGAQDPTTTIEAVSPSVLQVICTKNDIESRGTGFLISSNLLITNYHVVENLTRNCVAHENRHVRDYKLTYLRGDIRNDLALFRLDRTHKSSGLVVATKNPSPGREITVLGFPRGQTNLRSDVNYITEKEIEVQSDHGPIPRISHGARVLPGNSGGPIIDVNTQQVVGVIVDMDLYKTVVGDDAAPVGGGSGIPVRFVRRLYKIHFGKDLPVGPVKPSSLAKPASSILKVTVGPESPSVNTSAFSCDFLLLASPEACKQDPSLSLVKVAWLDTRGRVLVESAEQTVSCAASTDQAPSRITVAGDHFSRGDVVRCEVRPRMSGAVRSENRIQVANTPPQISSVQISPAVPTVDDRIYCDYDGYSDADGDAEKVRSSWFKWTVNGQPARAVLEGRRSRLRDPLKGNDEVRCEVTPFDGFESGRPIQADRTIQPRPTVSQVTLSPRTASVNTELRCAFNLMAPNVLCHQNTDAGSVRVTWLGANNQPIEEPRDINVGCGMDPKREYETKLQAGFAKGDVIRCQVHPLNHASKVVRSAPVKVVNSPPTLRGVQMLPKAPSVDSEVACRLDGVNDADGDQLTPSADWFKWTVDGQAAQSVWKEGQSVLTTPLSGNEEVVCAVTPFDGQDYGETVAVTRTIESRVTVRMKRPTAALRLDLRDNRGQILSSTPDPNDVQAIHYRLKPGTFTLTAQWMGERKQYDLRLGHRSDVIVPPAALMIRTTTGEERLFWRGPGDSPPAIDIQGWGTAKAQPLAMGRSEGLRLTGQFDLKPGEAEVWTIDVSKHPSYAIWDEWSVARENRRQTRRWLSAASATTVTASVLSIRWWDQYRSLQLLQSANTPLTDRDEIYDAVMTFEQEGPGLRTRAMAGGITTAGTALVTGFLVQRSSQRRKQSQQLRSQYHSARGTPYAIEALRVDE